MHQSVWWNSLIAGIDSADLAQVCTDLNSIRLVAGISTLHPLVYTAEACLEKNTCGSGFQPLAVPSVYIWDKQDNVNLFHMYYI